MGLINTYTDANKVTDTALKVQYAVVPDKYTSTGWVEDPDSGAESCVTYERIFYRVHRYATKSYSYVGMDYSTAVACQNAKVAKYTRNYSKVIVEE